MHVYTKFSERWGRNGRSDTKSITGPAIRWVLLMAGQKAFRRRCPSCYLPGFPCFFGGGLILYNFIMMLIAPASGAVANIQPHWAKKVKIAGRKYGISFIHLFSRCLLLVKPTWSEDQLVPIYRDGGIQDVYWTFSYSPVLGDNILLKVCWLFALKPLKKWLICRQLSESKKELEFAIDAADLGTWDLNPIHKQIYIQRAAQRMVRSAARRRNRSFQSDRNQCIPTIRILLSTLSGLLSRRIQEGCMILITGLFIPITHAERIVRAKGKALFDEQTNPYVSTGSFRILRIRHWQNSVNGPPGKK